MKTVLYSNDCATLCVAAGPIVRWAYLLVDVDRVKGPFVVLQAKRRGADRVVVLLTNDDDDQIFLLRDDGGEDAYKDT